MLPEHIAKEVRDITADLEMDLHCDLAERFCPEDLPDAAISQVVTETKDALYKVLREKLFFYLKTEE